MSSYSRDWMHLAYCRGKDPEWDTDHRRGPQQRRAEKLCAPCPVKVFCARYALSHAEKGSPPCGVIIAGIAMPENPVKDDHKRAMERLRKVAQQ